jgi:uncharacterized membrane protein YfcA
VGAVFHGSHGRLDWRVALAFGSGGMLTSYLAANISKQISPELLLVIFALLMIGIGLMLLFRRAREEEAAYTAKPSWLVMASGAGVGLLTGSWRWFSGGAGSSHTRGIVRPDGNRNFIDHYCH